MIKTIQCLSLTTMFPLHPPATYQSVLLIRVEAEIVLRQWQRRQSRRREAVRQRHRRSGATSGQRRLPGAEVGDAQAGGADAGCGGTVGQNSQELGRKDRTTRSSVHSFARTTHSFTFSGLLASLAPSAALTRSLARSLRSLPRSWESA